jgi:hypothetical protein
MTEREALEKMIPPSKHRVGKPKGGVIQIWLTRACDKACFGCTQGSNLGGKPGMITVNQFEAACKSLTGYFGIVGVFGGNPALHPKFPEICEIARRYFPKEKLGLWCNHPKGHGKVMAHTFNPAVSNLNVHLDRSAYDEFKRDWPMSRPFGLHQDSRHSPPYVAMKDVVADEAERWDLISNCDINQHWSAMIGVFRGELRAWFCEIAGAQAMLHQHEPDYPDTGTPIDENGLTNTSEWTDATKWETHDRWWRLPMGFYAAQVRKHCHECGVPLRGYGELAVSHPAGTEQVSLVHLNVYRPKKPDRTIEVVTHREALGKKLDKFTHYLQNSGK